MFNDSSGLAPEATQDMFGCHLVPVFSELQGPGRRSQNNKCQQKLSSWGADRHLGFIRGLPSVRGRWERYVSFKGVSLWFLPQSLRVCMVPDWGGLFPLCD